MNILDIICPRYYDEDLDQYTYQPIIQGFLSPAQEFRSDAALMAMFASDTLSRSSKEYYLKNTLYHYNQTSDCLIIIHPPANLCTISQQEYATGKIREHIQKPSALVIHLDFYNSVSEHGDEQTADRTVCCGSYNALIIITRLVRVAQYLRDADARLNITALNAQTQNGLTAKRIRSIGSLEGLKRVLQDNHASQSADVTRTSHLSAAAKRLRYELLSLKAIYAERVRTNKKYLGLFGVFGTHTAQEKLDAITAFLNDENAPLAKAAQKGELKKLIDDYRNGSV